MSTEDNFMEVGSVTVSQRIRDDGKMFFYIDVDGELDLVQALGLLETGKMKLPDLYEDEELEFFDEE